MIATVRVEIRPTWILIRVERGREQDLMIREYSPYKLPYITIYLARLLLPNVRLCRTIVRASRNGLAAHLMLQSPVVADC